MGPRSSCPAHRAALATVTRISFTLAGVGALAGCIEAPDTPAEPWMESDADLAGDGSPAPDAMAEPPIDDRTDAMVDAADAMVDGWVDALAPDADPEAADAAPDALADAEVWSETTPCPSPADDPEAWQACCEAKGWGWDDPNCAAWGPPMPPRMVA